MTTITETSSSRLVRKIRLRALLFFALALVAGAGAVFLVKTYMDRARAASATAPIAATLVVVAAEPVPIGTRLQGSHLAVVRWPVGDVPDGAFESVEQVVGRSVQRDLVAGEPVLATRLADPQRGDGLAAILEDGHRAMAVKVDQVIGVAGFVQPGDSVDVITTMKPDLDSQSLGRAARVAKIFLQNIRVLAVGEHLSTDGHKPITVQVVTLEVTPDQAERLALASQHGEIQLTMRSRVDRESVPTSGITPDMLLAADEGAEPREAAPARAPEPPPAPARRHSTRRARSHRSSPAASVTPAAPAAPVVEILRAGKVEERKLRPSSDAK